MEIEKELKEIKKSIGLIMISLVVLLILIGIVAFGNNTVWKSQLEFNDNIVDFVNKQTELDENIVDALEKENITVRTCVGDCRIVIPFEINAEEDENITYIEVDWDDLVKEI